MTTRAPAAWVGDGLVELDRAVVPVDDRGLTTGDGCFETMKVVRGVPFAITRHLARLARSCRLLEIDFPPEELVRTACAAVISANGPGVGRVRVTVTAGRAPLGPHRGDSSPGFFVLTGPPRQLSATSSVAVCPWVRNERSPLAGAKATSYGENVVAQRWAAARGCDEALFANTRGELCEGTGSNVFLVVGGVLRTPPLTSGCLAGVTRDLACELAGEVDDSPVGLEELAAADELFLTSSTRDIHPVGTIDGRELAAPGHLTASLRERWHAMEARTLDP